MAWHWKPAIATDWMKQFAGKSVVASRDVGCFLRLSNQPCTEFKNNILIFQQSFTWSTFYFPCAFVTFLIPYHVFLSLSTTVSINVCSKFWNTRYSIETDSEQCLVLIVFPITELDITSFITCTGSFQDTNPVVEKTSVQVASKGIVRVGKCPLLLSFWE